MNLSAFPNVYVELDQHSVHMSRLNRPAEELYWSEDVKQDVFSSVCVKTVIQFTAQL